MHKARKQLVFPSHPCLTLLHRGNPLEFLDESFTHVTERQTNGQ